MSDQVVNSAKTSIFFSYNTLPNIRNSIFSSFSTSISTQFEKYLGLFPVVGRVKKRAFNEIKNRVFRRLQGWKEKLLSQAGQEVLIKAVIQAIPTYAMSCFKFPVGLCADLSSMATRFWWGQRGDEQIHWLSKRKLMRPKHEGGIGFRDLQLFNRALLARQGWRLLQNQPSLVFQVLKVKYFPCTAFLEASIPSNSSYIWRSICESIDVLHNGLCWQVGTGEKIKIWKDRWLLNPTTFKVVSPIQILDADATVDSLICGVTMRWKSELLNNIFLPHEVETIQAIPLSHRKPNDVLIWTGTKNGVFSMRSAYKMLLSNTFAAEASSSSPTNHENQLWLAIWSASVQPKVRVFIWKACKGILPTRTNLFDKGLSNSFSCVWCEDEAKTGDHLL